VRAGSPDLALEARVPGGPDRYEFHTTDGVCSPESFRPAELALADALWERDPGRLWVPEANYGVVGCLAAPIADHVEMTETSARAAAICRENVGRNGVEASVELGAGLGAELLPAKRECRSLADGGTRSGPPDTVAYAPKAYASIDVCCQRIATALDLLEPRGACLVAAAPEVGLSRYRAFLEEHAAGVEAVGELDDAVVLAAECPDGFDPPQLIEPTRLTPSVDGLDLDLVSLPGLFAAGALDHGTRVLCEALPVDDGDRVLDVCCGYGPIGTYAAAAADCSVWLSDDDRLATRCAAASLERTGVEGTVITGDCTAGVANRRFDLVAVNPPTHAGSGVLAALFAGIRGVLAPGGRCYVVRHASLDLSAYLRGFGTVETVARGTEHVVRTAARGG